MIYPLDSAIQLLNDWGQKAADINCSTMVNNVFGQ